MADEREVLPLRSQVEQYWIHDVVHIGADMITYRAEDMRLNLEVWLSEYFPAGMAKRHTSADGKSTVYVHPTDSEFFSEGKVLKHTIYNVLKEVETQGTPSVVQTFESGGTFYVAMKYPYDDKPLAQLLSMGKTFSERQIGGFAISLVALLVGLQRHNLQVRSLEPDFIQINAAKEGRVVGYAEWLLLEEDSQDPIYEIGRLLYAMVTGKTLSATETLQPLQADRYYSAALCDLINRTVSEAQEERPQTLQQLQTLLQNNQPDEVQCEPLVCSQKSNLVSSFARLASIFLIVVFAYYVNNQPQRIQAKELSWLDTARFHLVAYFGNADAQQALGHMYENGYGVDLDAHEAFQWYTKAAEQGNIYAQLSLGHMYINGTGVAKDAQEAVHWFQEAAGQGDETAQYNLGYLYAQGIGVTKNSRLSTDWYEKAAAQGNKQAKLRLADFYKVQVATPEAHEKAKSYYRELEREGNKYAQKNLADLMLYGKGKRNPEDAFKIFLKLAYKGDVYSQTNIGYLYMTGKGTSLDYTKAMYWLGKAAKQGDGFACGCIGYLYRYGKGVSRSKREALNWFEKGASRDDLYSKGALKELTKQKEQRNIVQKNHVNKATHYTDVYKQYRLGYQYEKGIDVARNHKEALKYYLLAAKQGDGNAQFRLAQLYERSDEIRRDYKAAVYWYKKASEHDDALAFYRVSKLYRAGHGVKKDERVALKWCKEAANRGLGVSRGILGACYEFGWGTRIDYGKARYWYEKAIERDYRNAKDSLERLKKKIRKG